MHACLFVYLLFKKVARCLIHNDLVESYLPKSALVEDVWWLHTVSFCCVCVSWGISLLLAVTLLPGLLRKSYGDLGL